MLRLSLLIAVATLTLSIGGSAVLPVCAGALPDTATQSVSIAVAAPTLSGSAARPAPLVQGQPVVTATPVWMGVGGLLLVTLMVIAVLFP